MRTTAITVKELEKICKSAINDGFGDKKIILSDYDEGNGYHEMFYGFTPVNKKDYIYSGGPILPNDVDEDNIEDYIILG